MDFLDNISKTLSSYMALSEMIKQDEDRFIQNPKYLLSEMIHIMDEYNKNK
jgi:hypothetical protein